MGEIKTSIDENTRRYDKLEISTHIEYLSEIISDFFHFFSSIFYRIGQYN